MQDNSTLIIMWITGFFVVIMVILNLYNNHASECQHNIEPGNVIEFKTGLKGVVIDCVIDGVKVNTGNDYVIWEYNTIKGLNNELSN